MDAHEKVIVLFDETNLRNEELDCLWMSDRWELERLPICRRDSEILRGKVNRFRLAIGGEESDDNAVTRTKRIKRDDRYLELREMNIENIFQREVKGSICLNVFDIRHQELDNRRRRGRGGRGGRGGGRRGFQESALNDSIIWKNIKTYSLKDLFTLWIRRASTLTLAVTLALAVALAVAVSCVRIGTKRKTSWRDGLRCECLSSWEVIDVIRHHKDPLKVFHLIMPTEWVNRTSDRDEWRIKMLSWIGKELTTVGWVERGGRLI
jgi:hypothetical protein